MSMTTCNSCESFIDTDEEPDSCVDMHFICERCRELDFLRGENERLERKKNDYPNVLAKLFNDLEAVRSLAVEREAILRGALKFYANDDNYNDNGAPFSMEESHECVHPYIRLDIGKKAKTTLKELGIEKEGE